MTEKFFITSERLEEFNEIFRKDVTYGNIKSHKKPGFHPLFRRYIFRKSTGRGFKLTLPPVVLGLRKKFGFIYTTPIYSLSLNSRNLGQYCKYQLIKYKLWENTLHNAWGSQEESDCIFIDKQQKCLQ